MIEPPQRVDLDGGVHLREFQEDDADAVARAVKENLAHLRPWMPWADEQSGDPDFQRERLRKLRGLSDRQEEWQYGLFPADEQVLLGSFGIMTRRGPGTIEIGYWLAADATGHGYATAAAGALTDVARGFAGIHRVYICVDEANTRSAAVARRLGYDVLRTEQRVPEATAELGRLMLFAVEIA